MWTSVLRRENRISPRKSHYSPPYNIVSKGRAGSTSGKERVGALSLSPSEKLVRPYGAPGRGRSEQERADVQAEVEDRQQDRRQEMVPREVCDPVHRADRNVVRHNNSTHRNNSARGPGGRKLSEVKMSYIAKLSEEELHRGTLIDVTTRRSGGGWRSSMPASKQINAAMQCSA